MSRLYAGVLGDVLSVTRTAAAVNLIGIWGLSVSRASPVCLARGSYTGKDWSSCVRFRQRAQLSSHVLTYLL